MLVSVMLDLDSSVVSVLWVFELRWVSILLIWMGCWELVMVSLLFECNGWLGVLFGLSFMYILLSGFLGCNMIVVLL